MAGKYSELNRTERDATYRAMMKQITTLTEATQASILNMVVGYLVTDVIGGRVDSDEIMDAFEVAFNISGIPRTGWVF